MEKIGPAEFRARVDAEFASFVQNADAYLKVENLEGPVALRDAYLQMLGNKVAAKELEKADGLRFSVKKDGGVELRVE